MRVVAPIAPSNFPQLEFVNQTEMEQAHAHQVTPATHAPLVKTQAGMTLPAPRPGRHAYQTYAHAGPARAPTTLSRSASTLGFARRAEGNRSVGLSGAGMHGHESPFSRHVRPRTMIEEDAERRLVNFLARLE